MVPWAVTGRSKAKSGPIRSAAPAPGNQARAEARGFPSLPAQRGGEPYLAGAFARLRATLPDRRAGMAGAGDARPVRGHDRKGGRRPLAHAQDQGIARGRAPRKAPAPGAARQPRGHARGLPVAHRRRTGDVRGAGTACARLRTPPDGDSRPRKTAKRSTARCSSSRPAPPSSPPKWSSRGRTRIERPSPSTRSLRARPVMPLPCFAAF